MTTRPLTKTKQAAAKVSNKAAAKKTPAKKTPTKKAAPKKAPTATTATWRQVSQWKPGTPLPRYWSIIWAPVARLWVVGGGANPMLSADGKKWRKGKADIGQLVAHGADVLAVSRDGVIATNDGEVWSARSTPPKHPSISHAGLASVDGALLIAMTGDDANGSHSQSVVHRSVDAGRTWKAVATLGYLMSWASAEGVVIGVGDNLCVVSRDGGMSWSEARGVTGNFYAVAMGNQTVIAVGDKNVCVRSLDGGQTWSQLGLGPSKKALDGAWVSPDGQCVIIVGREGRLWRSLDAGTTWLKDVVPESVAPRGTEPPNLLAIAADDAGNVVVSGDLQTLLLLPAT